MILTPDEARQGFCKVQQLTMRPGRPIETMCVAYRCIAYWRWADAEHTKGYCALAGRPEF
jgi:hypothetical protein